MAGPCWMQDSFFFKKNKKLRCFPDSALAELGLQIKVGSTVTTPLCPFWLHPGTTLKFSPAPNILHISERRIYREEGMLDVGYACAFSAPIFRSAQWRWWNLQGSVVCRYTAPSINSYDMCDLGQAANSPGLLCTFWKTWMMTPAIQGCFPDYMK